jgi:hypothetical protein
VEAGVSGDEFAALIEQSVALGEDRVEVSDRLEVSVTIGSSTSGQRCSAGCICGV